MKRRRKIIGLMVIFIGLSIFLYPIVKQAYTSYMQKQFFADIKEQILVSAMGQGASETPVPATTTAPIAPTIGIESDERIVTVLEEEEVEDTQTPENVKNRLGGQQVIGIIEIEKIDLIYAIVEGTTDSNLGVAIGHMTETVALGEVGNCALAGHRGGTSGPFFKNLNKLVSGDEIKITDAKGHEFIYKVTESFVVEPTDVWVADRESESKELTLITCQESGTKRLIVKAVAD